MTSIDRCPKCDQPKGDQARADALPIVREWLASRSVRWSDVAAAQAADQPGMCIEGQCRKVDWRARALESERRLADHAPGRAAAPIVPHGLSAKILAALQWTSPVDALQVAHHGRLGYSDEAIEAIKRAAEGMVEAGLLEQTAGWDATWRLPRKAVRRG